MVLHALLRLFPSSRDMNIAHSSPYLTWSSKSTCSSTYVRSSFSLPTHNYGIKLAISIVVHVASPVHCFPYSFYLQQTDHCCVCDSIFWLSSTPSTGTVITQGDNEPLTTPAIHHHPIHKGFPQMREIAIIRPQETRPLVSPFPFTFFRSKRNMSRRNYAHPQSSPLANCASI